MCAVGLYFVFLLLEEVIVGYYSTNATSQSKDKNLTAAYNTFQKARDMTRIKRNSDGKKKFLYLLNISTTSERPSKKWKLEKVTRKQFEIINMLWRKTKIFMNEDDIYTTNPIKQHNATKTIRERMKDKNPSQFSSFMHSLSTTTPSKIEFYYMDDIKDEFDEKHCKELNCKQNIKTLHNYKGTSNLPFLVFHLKGPNAKIEPVKVNSRSLNISQLLSERVKNSWARSKKLPTVPKKLKENPSKEDEKNNVHVKAFHSFPHREYLFGKTTKLTLKNYLNNSINNDDKTSPESTTIYDKIKFFEIYDQYTPTLNFRKDSINFNDEKVIDSNEKSLLEHVDQGGHDHIRAKHSMKHIITENFENLIKPLTNNFSQKADEDEHTESNVHKKNVTQKQTNETFYVLKENSSKPLISEYKSNYYLNQSTSWSEYPFTAVYIYEPSQVHCDAAAISAHWLIASGACLTRAINKPYGGGPSAFVTYCGEKWWLSERIAYVKYSVVHPWFHPRDKTRKYLYNIGVIQVVNSMISACTGWAPVSLMSHQLAADSESSWALAVGWGLDRFDTKYGTTDLPKIPLTIYKGALYLDSCPGSIEYSKAKRLDEKGWVENVHCLSLPPYSDEDTDPVHGSLLLVSGKLVALYLQEERRPWGEQSAQYTGVWRLIPWVMEVAKEPDDMDTIIFEI